MPERSATARVAASGSGALSTTITSSGAGSARASDARQRASASGRPRVVAGVPPDYFSSTGQLWGNPLYAWAMHEQEGYHWWIARVRTLFTLCDIVRIDHFRGFESY